MSSRSAVRVFKHVWTESRPCDFALNIVPDGGCLFADFDILPDRRARLVRLSLDGSGCHDAASVEPLPLSESQALIAAVAGLEHGDELTSPTVITSLLHFLHRDPNVPWIDALTDNNVPNP